MARCKTVDVFLNRYASPDKMIIPEADARIARFKIRWVSNSLSSNVWASAGGSELIGYVGYG